MQRNLTLLACFFVCANCFAQQYPFVYYTPKDGLVNSRVRSIRQDSKGRMYFLTFGGLSVYDGTGFTNYSQQDGLANELVNDIVEVAPDSFLVATNTQKVNTLSHGKLGMYKPADGFYPVINCFFKSHDGNLYAGADEGLFVLKDRKFIRLPLVWDGRDVGHYFDKIFEYRNFLLLGSWNTELNEKLVLYDKSQQKVTDLFIKDKVMSLVSDLKKRIWIGLPGYIQLLDTSALRQGKFVFQPIPLDYQKLIDQNNSTIFFDRQGNHWFFRNNEIQKILPDLQSQIISAAEGLKTGSLTDIFEDREGIIWMASDGNGVIKMRNTNIQLIDRILPGSPMSITAIKDQNDTLWLFNTTDNTILRLYKKEINVFPLKEKLNIANLYIIGEKLYFTDSKKMICIENKDNADSYLHPREIINDPSPAFAFGNGVIDVHGVLIQFIKRNDTLYSLIAIRDGKVISETRIGYATDQIAIDNHQQIWLATRQSQLLVFRLNPENPVSYFELVKDFTKDLELDAPRSIVVDKNNSVWIGTRYDGLYRLQFDGLHLLSSKQFTTKNGLTDNFICDLHCDSDNTLWIGTQTGLDKIFFKNGQYVIANVSKNNNIFQLIHKIAITNENTVWALNNEGTILRIRPSTAPNQLQPPRLLLTSLKINNKLYDGPGTHFPFDQNNLSFSVAAPSFIDERSIKYSYQLKGSSNNSWSDPSNNASFNFINLPPGDYTLQVKADFPEALYPSQKMSYSFIILAPWWQTWWFRGLAAVMILSIFLFWIRSYYKRRFRAQQLVLEKQQAIEKERTRIATDMHDDLGAGLSRIKFLSETIGIKKQQQQPIEEDISKIREYSHEMIDKMGEIVWALNEKNDSLSDLLGYARAYAVDYLSQNGIVCKVETPENFPNVFVSGEFRRNIYLSVKEALHNIVKHAEATQVNIVIGTNHRLTIILQDDGVGFDSKNPKPFRNGLANMKKRMTDIGGFLEIKNEKGTTVKLSVPLPL